MMAINFFSFSFHWIKLYYNILILIFFSLYTTSNGMYQTMPLLSYLQIVSLAIISGKDLDSFKFQFPNRSKPSRLYSVKLINWKSLSLSRDLEIDYRKGKGEEWRRLVWSVIEQSCATRWDWGPTADVH